MNAVRGRVQGGKVVLETVLPEGTEVVVTAAGDEDGFELAEAEVLELQERIAAANRGELVPAAEVLEKLRTR